MKHIYKSVFLATGLLSLTACSDFLDQSSPSEMNDKVVFNNEYYTELTLNKVYGGLTQDKTYSQFMPIQAGLNTDCELIDGLGSDAQNTTHQRGVFNYNASPGFADLETVWNNMYGVIEDANLVINGVDNSSLIEEGNESRATMLRFRAEAKTLRAMIYLDLIRLFGDVPYKVEISKSDLSNAYLGKTDRDVIMENLIADLEESIPDLPWAGEQTTEHVTRGYAHGLLANIALTRAGWFIRESAKEGYITATKNSDDNYPTQRCDDETRKKTYELAEKHLSTIINSGKHALTSTPEQYWLDMNVGNLQTSTPENLFEIPMGINKSGELGYTVGFRVNGLTPDYGKKGNSTGTLKLTAPYFYSFDRDDTRRDLTCATYQLENKSSYTEAMLGNAPFGIYCGKWDYRKMAGNPTWLEAVLAGDEKAKICSGINVVKMRYAYVLLMYAEVVNELHKTQTAYGTDLDGKNCTLSAYDALLQVHQRAFTDRNAAATKLNQLIADKGFFEAIVQENAWELAGEGVRKFDLIRWNLLSDKIDEFKSTYEAHIGNDDGTGAKWPQKIYFNYKKNSDKAYKEIDQSSITWYETPADTKAYEANKDSFGKIDTKQKDTNLPSISSGLNTPVKNRYLLPLYSRTISTSNGTLKNSYGYN